jgi:hypothetical protein
MGTSVSRPYPRTPAQWRLLAEDKLGAWWRQWEAPLRRHDDLLATVAAGDNFALLAKQMGVGRQKWLGEALVEADMWDARVLVLCPPAVRLFWCQSLLEDGFAADRIDAQSIWQASRAGIRAEAALLEQIDAANVLVIEPPCRTKTKLFAALAKQVREACSTTQIVTTTTLVWGSAMQPPRYADSCLKLLGYLDAPEDIKVCWAEDCWEAVA